MTTKIGTSIYKVNRASLLLNGISFLLLMAFTTSSSAAIYPQDSLLNAVKIAPLDSKKIDIVMKIAKNYLNSPPRQRRQKDIIDCFSILGGIYAHNGNYNKALACHIKALKLAETNNDKKRICEAYISMGVIFFEQKKFNETIAYMNKALIIEGQRTSTRNLTYIYNNLGIAYKSLNQLNKSLFYQLKALKLNQELGDNYGIAICYNNLSGLYNALNKPDTALVYCLRSISISEKLNYSVGLTYSYIVAGDYYEKLNDEKTAGSYYLKALKIARQINYKTEIREAYEHLSFLSEKTGNLRQALEYLKLYSEINDAILNEENLRQTNELNIRYETEKKEKAILLLTKDQQLKNKTLKQQQISRFGLIACLSLLLIVFIVLYNRYRFKQKANLKLTQTQDELYKLIEQKEKLTSILAHDLKTPLRFMTSISTFLSKNMDSLEREKREKLLTELCTSSKNTYAFADELLTWLSVQQQNFTIVITSVSLNDLMTELYVFFQDIAKAQQTEIIINPFPPVSITTDKRLLKIILRNILDNAIKNTHAGEIRVSVLKLNAQIIELSITDTGNGMTKEQLQMLDVENTYGFLFEIKNKLGFQIIKDLATMLTIKLKVNSEIKVGTTVTLLLPIEKADKTG
ncbi:MAG TPA: tetratricopeptide repeat-containing sensor histidine kinase [Bacteroidia bacterium]|nr:tetratricopeptide repeat-containing sensor histidine kinase [Bacteroidia bacterium]